MYEKNGLMVKLTNPRCIEYIRGRGEDTNSSIVEAALLRKFGFPEKEKKRTYASRRGRKKTPGVSTKAFPVKITDRRIIDEILRLREHGVIQRHTVESALLDMIKKEE